MLKKIKMLFDLHYFVLRDAFHNFVESLLMIGPLSLSWNYSVFSLLTATWWLLLIEPLSVSWNYSAFSLLTATWWLLLIEPLSVSWNYSAFSLLTATFF